MQTLESFLAAYNPGDYEQPSVTADIAVFTCGEDATLRILLIKRGGHPYLGMHALPGGFIEMRETLLASAARELHEETGLSGIPLHPFGVFGEPSRDPRTRIVTTAFAALAPAHTLAPAAGDDAAEAVFFDLHISAHETITIPQQRKDDLLLHLPCSDAGRTAAVGRRIALTLRRGDLALRSELALCSDGLVHFPVLLKTDLACDHALIITQALQWLCALPRENAARALYPAAPGIAMQPLQSISSTLCGQ